MDGTTTCFTTRPTTDLTAPGGFEVLSADELAYVVGGDLYETAQGASSFVQRQLGGCGCAAGH